jgi:hypothetical protein
MASSSCEDCLTLLAVAAGLLSGEDPLTGLLLAWESSAALLQ